MWGAIIGDFAGSIYEFEQSKNISIIKKSKLIEDNSFFSDDTILTIAIIDAILNNGDYKEYLKKYAKEYMNSVPKDLPYFEKMFSSGFAKWVYSDEEGHSNGNGAMMRISGVGYLFDSKEEIIKNARLATIPSHNNPSSIENATIVAMIIYLSRIGYSKEKIIETLNIDLKYAVSIGDDYNDISMFKETGLSIAMGNANDEVKSFVKYITKTNNENGVAYVLEKIMKGEVLC